MNRIDPTDHRADNLTYVAVCRTCGGWQYLASAYDADIDPIFMRDVKRAAKDAVARDADFVKVRFGDVNMDMCECPRVKRQANQEALAI